MGPLHRESCPLVPKWAHRADVGTVSGKNPAKRSPVGGTVPSFPRVGTVERTPSMAAAARRKSWPLVRKWAHRADVGTVSGKHPAKPSPVGGAVPTSGEPCPAPSISHSRLDLDPLTAVDLFSRRSPALSSRHLVGTSTSRSGANCCISPDQMRFPIQPDLEPSARESEADHAVRQCRTLRRTHCCIVMSQISRSATCWAL